MTPFEATTRMPVLFARYIAGQISDNAWRAFTDVADALAPNSEERAALVHFFSDAIEDLGGDAIKIPRRSEAESMLGVLRASV